MTSPTDTVRHAGHGADPGILPVAVVALGGAAWLILLWPSAGHAHGSAGLGPSPVAGWALMVVAMMLPPALPLLQTVRRLVSRRRAPTALVALAAATFLGVWLLAGLGFLLGDLLLAPVARHLPAQIVAGTAAVGAGLYQFTPVKRACLTACRSPRGVALAAWCGARPAAVEVAAIGWRFGIVCVGCCWALMLLTFTVGAGAMPVMVLVSAVMLAERLLPRTRRLVPAVALGCVALGVLILAGIVPPVR